ncbi:uncharacterized protein LOC105764956 [Gossypium raimondii]|uniref:DUF4220 domain-containing protein n=1 Tax=Gossypium raimondii TaxID=29730 RepID=A0A0D2U7N5_GOSRA|nr:uncharacterized protein LOC105764956 [Gossypium raimondii]KJB51540.1 hypothetical protein B456_008G221400 [Gossypium raimondii]MBA0593222.1 hypothetical protein [Gossypium raimondii]
MVDPIPPEVQKVWDKWNIRGTILFSLSLQTFLVLLAPYRKSTRKRILIMLIWSAYLLADAAANFTVGLISNNQGSGSKKSGSSTSKSSSHHSNDALLAFWAPFLLLHLGGPDTITAFALEDNELWLRHLLGLGFQAVATLYVFAQSLPKNRFWVPTVLMFVAGTIKYVERTRALYLASLDRFRDSMLKEADPGPNYAKLMEEYASKRDNKLPTRIIMIPEPDKEARATDMPVKEGKLNNLEVVHYAYKYFLIFKGLVVDLIFSFRERNESREFFKKRKPIDALRVIEVELNFIYEVLYTKVQVVHSAWGYIFRCVAFASIVAALSIFHFRTRKHDLNQFDVGITYTLLLGAVVLDLIALLMLIFSDWTFATIKDPDSNPGILAWLFSSFLRFRMPWWRSCDCTTPLKPEEKPIERINHKVLSTPILFRRWSGSLSSFNLISYCLQSHTRRIHKFTRWPLVIAKDISTFLRIDACFDFAVDLIKKFTNAITGLLSCVIIVLDFINNKVSTAITYVVDKLNHITGLHHVIKKTSILCGHVRTFIMGSMGLKDFIDEILYVSREPFTKELWEFIFDELKTKANHADDPETAKRISAARGEWIIVDSDTKVDRSSLMPYITDVQYDESIILWHIATDLCYYTSNGKKLDKESFNYREFSKLLSDYMLYLLIWQPTMMSAVGGIGKIRFRDTYAEADRFFASRGLPSLVEKLKGSGSVEAKACEAILSVTTNVKPVAVKGDRSKSVLFDASMLAQELNRLEGEGLDKWKLMSRVWVELMSYAASHCRANTHAQQVSKGGELITFIWLLMAHFGLGEQFQINEGHARAKLIVGK